MFLPKLPQKSKFDLLTVMIFTEITPKVNFEICQSSIIDCKQPSLQELLNWWNLNLKKIHKIHNLKSLYKKDGIHDSCIIFIHHGRNGFDAKPKIFQVKKNFPSNKNYFFIRSFFLTWPLTRLKCIYRKSIYNTQRNIVAMYFMNEYEWHNVVVPSNEKSMAHP